MVFNNSVISFEGPSALPPADEIDLKLSDYALMEVDNNLADMIEQHS